MGIKQNLLIWGCLLWAVTGAAQTADTNFFYLGYTSTGVINQTNTTRSYLFNNNIRAGLSRKYFEANVSQSWIYGWQQTGLTNNDFSSVVDADLFKRTHRFYLWSLAAYDKSYSLKINNRVQLGAGLGFKMISTPSLTVTLSDGPLYETTRLYDTTTYLTVRNSFRLKYRLTVKKILVFEGVNFIQHSFLSGEDYIVKTSNNASLRLTGWLNLTASVIYNHINLNQRENLLCTFGLSINRYF